MYVHVSYLLGACALLVCAPWSFYSCLHSIRLHLVEQVNKDQLFCLNSKGSMCILRMCTVLYEVYKMHAI